MKGLTLLFIPILFASCATVISGSRQTVNISANTDANVKITNQHGNEVFNGITPATVKLKRGVGYFKPAKYTLSFSKDGYQPKDYQLNGNFNAWYVGNIVLGGGIGAIIVDPITGAMWKFDEKEVKVGLEKH